MKELDFSRPMSYVRALGLPFRIMPLATVVNFMNHFVQMAIAPLTVLITAYFIDTALEVFNYGLDSRVIILPLVAIAAFRLYGYLLDPFLALVNKRAEQRKWLYLSYPLVRRQASLNMVHLENGNDMDLTARVHDGDKLTEVWDNISQIIFNLGQLAIYAVILFANISLPERIPAEDVQNYYNGYINGAAANGSGGELVMFYAILGGYVISTIWIARREYALEQRLTRPTRLMEGYADHLTNRESAHERTLFGFAHRLNERWHKTFTYIFTARFRFKRWSTLVQGIMYGALIIIMIRVYELNQAPPPIAEYEGVNAGFELLGMSTGMSMATIMMLINASGALAAIIVGIGQVVFQRRYIREFNQYIALSRDEGYLAALDEAPPIFEKLELRGVSFSYPGMDKQVLRDCSLVIEKGKRYALVGANGSGKTTLARLLLRMYDNYEGEILLNGKSLKEWPLQQIKSMTAAVFQSFSRYDISLADNVAAGAGFAVGEDKIDGAITTAGLTEPVAALPDGKDTLLGKVHPGGAELSGGQWQRIAIARAVVSRAQLKILDEPTAALDPMAEFEMYTQFDRISSASATIFISHRLASAKLADEIFVLQDGAIVEHGTHDTLMAQGGLYSYMFESQRGWYA